MGTRIVTGVAMVVITIYLGALAAEILGGYVIPRKDTQ